MKILFLATISLISALCAAAQQPAVPIVARTAATGATTNAYDPDATREHDAFWAAWRAKAPDGLTMTNREFWQWKDKVYKQFAEDAQAFARKYPKDPRRWDGLIQSGYTPPYFVTGFKPEFDAQPREANLMVDETALAAFKERQSKVNREAIFSDETTIGQRRGSLGWMIDQILAAARKEGGKPDFTPLDPVMDEIAAKLPDDRGATLFTMYLQVLHQSAPDKATALDAKLADQPIGKAMKEMAAKAEQARAAERKAMMERAADIGTNKFTAADGREVDLTQLRGKVVMIDFWATWCGPCIAELPNVIANYQKYHDKGFEIVGISLENSGVTATDTEEAKAGKLAIAKQKMLDFTKKRDMPWPQYYDGLYWKNLYAVKYGINAIPATLLLDTDGKVAVVGARGPDLEPAIKRLLGPL